MNKRIFVLGIIVLMIAVVTAATVMFVFPYEPKLPPRADDTNSTPQGIQEVVVANNKFAFDLYFEFAEYEEKNIFYSPYSISSALAITYEGARGQTADEIKSVFYFPEFDILRPNFAAIYNKINEPEKNYELRTGNALWIQYDYPLLEKYTETVERYYGGKAANLDFVRETEASRQIINSFIAEQTNNRIEELLAEDSIPPTTKLIITNAVYFKGNWELEFDESETKDMDFKITPDETVEVPMMYMKPEETFNYTETENLQFLELPYKNRELSMFILLPIEDIDSIESYLTEEKFEELKSDMEETGLDAIFLPKFEFETGYDMKENLMNMGMPTPFSLPDFSGIDGTRELFIQGVVHKAFISVDEQGTEAAAATAVIMPVRVRPSFRADRPFIFIIQENETGNILFLGRVVNPLQS